MASLLILPLDGNAQQWQGQITVDSRVGYSTNTILNPFHGEWDRSTGSGYGLIAPMGQLSRNSERYSADFSGGGVLEPFFDGRQTLKGGFALMNLRRRIGSSWSAGVETGSRYFSSSFDQSMVWVQPTLTWSPTLFSQIRLKAGSTFRDYSNDYQDQEEAEITQNDRFDLYGVEYEAWPTFTWRISTGVYGNMDDPTDNLSFMINSDQHISDAFRLTLRLNADSYSYQLMHEVGSGGTGGPIGGGDDGYITLDETDRLLRAGLSGRLRVSPSFSLTLNLDHLSLHSSASEQTLSDYQLSTGVRYTFQPSLGGRGKARAQWDQNGNQSVMLKVNYSGAGQLYLIGDFNDWENPGIPLSRQSSNRYAAQLSLPTGSYEYKILLIEGTEKKWIGFSEDTYTVSDGFGGSNGLVFIQ
ncbi:MAG: glycogen-binding domain-containing protein [Balneolales bacterium]